MNQFTEFGIAMAATALTVVLLFALSWPLSVISRIGDRRKIRRFLRESGCSLVSLKRIVGDIGHDDYLVVYRENGVSKKVAFRTLDGSHFYIWPNDHEASHLVFFNDDGSMKLHQLPNPSLINGQFLYYRRNKKNTIGTSLIAAALAWPVSTSIVLLLGYEVVQVYHVIFHFLSAIRPFVPQSRLLSAIGLVVLLAVSILFYVLIPVLLAIAAYRLTRFETIISDTPICLKCGYDLRGNVSGTCPECGGVVEPDEPDD